MFICDFVGSAELPFIEVVIILLPPTADDVDYDLTACLLPRCCFNGNSFYSVPEAAISMLLKFTHLILKIIPNMR